MISHTVLVVLGHVAVALRDVPRITETILHQCLMRRLYQPPSLMANLIVDQLGCILLSMSDKDNEQVNIFSYFI